MDANDRQKMRESIAALSAIPDQKRKIEKLLIDLDLERRMLKAQMISAIHIVDPKTLVDYIGNVFKDYPTIDPFEEKEQ
jgi:hypothetical protein